jgi:peptidoglycan/xylan/chitin deacetylase (PgdA/CDA1 family)
MAHIVPHADEGPGRRTVVLVCGCLSRRGILLGALALAGCSTTKRSAPNPAPSSATANPTTSAPSTRAAGSPATEIASGAGVRREVALTFHTNGDDALVDGLLTAVDRLAVPITTMLVCNWAQTHPRTVGRIRDAGHEIGNHTWSHLADLDRQSAPVVRAEVERSRDALVRLVGGATPWFRPSAMHHSTPTVLAEAGRAGYAHCLSYDVDPLDYTDPGADAVVDRTLAAVRPGSIVSLHFGHAGTIPAMERIVDGLAARNLTPVTVSALLA